MSQLSAFLHPAASEEERAVIISDRFLDGEGKPVPFKIRALTQEQVDDISKRSTKTVKDKNGVREDLDSAEFSRRMILAAVAEPDFSSRELCEAYGVLDPLLAPGRMLRPGEYTKLLREISDRIHTLENAQTG